MWIGYTDRLREGHWNWANTGKDGSYTGWYEGEPNDLAGQDCATLWVKGTWKYYWDDITCMHVQRFVCEKGVCFCRD